MRSELHLDFSSEGKAVLFSPAEFPLTERLGGGSWRGGKRTRQQRIPNLGGRLAIGENGILYGSAYSPFGGNSPVGGVRTAALGTMTLIKSAPAVVVDVDGKSIEPQPIKYRALFPSEDVETSEIEITDKGQLVQRLSASLDVEGSGEVKLPAGTKHSPLKARLVINREKPAAQRPSLAIEKLLEAVPFEIQPAGPEDLDIGGDRLEIAAVNRALLDRLDAGESDLPALSWDGPGIQAAVHQGTQTGIYSTEILAFGPAGNRGKIRLLRGSTVLAETGDLRFLPGQPYFGTGVLRALPPPQAPGISPGLVPADGTTVIKIILEDVRDSSGNLVEDGSPVVWSAEGYDGELVDAGQSVLVGGRAEVSYRAGVEPGEVILRAGAGEGEARLEKTLTITQAPLEILMTEAWPTVQAETRSSAGPAAEGTAVVWATSRGTVQYQAVLTGGRSQAIWSSTGIQERPGTPFPRWVNLFAAVGRARGDFRYDTRAAAEPQPGRPLILLNRDRIVIDTAADQQTAASASASLEMGPLESKATATVVGQPGEAVRLVLGSTRFPVVEPAAAFALDAIEDGETPELYGGAAAIVGPGVEVDTSDPAHLPAFRFGGSDGLTVADEPALQMTGSFGFNLWVRFSDLGDEQTLIEKVGSYRLHLVTADGEPRLEFQVWSGGEVKGVLSHQVVTAGTWYSVAAQVREGRLRLAVGDDDRVDLGDSVAAVDLTSSPLEIGSSLRGGLDEVAVYDFRRPPTMAFADGAVEKDVTLDAEGRAEVEIWSGTGLFDQAARSFIESSSFGEGPATQAAASPVRPVGPFADRLRAIPVRVYTAPEPGEPDIAPELLYLDSYLKGIFGQSARECAEGLGSGESEDTSGTWCDISASFIPGVGAVQTVRDAYVVARNFAHGKRDVGNYIKAAFVVVGLAALAVPGARAAKGVFEKARVAVTGTQAEARIAREALKKVGRIVGEGVSETESVAVRMLANDADQEAKEAMTLLLGVCDVRLAAMAVTSLPGCAGLTDEALEALNRVAPRFGEAPFVKVLGRLRNKGFGEDIIERLVRALDNEALRTLKLSDNGLEGLAVFLSHTKSAGRLPNVWRELTQFVSPAPLPPQQAEQVVERLCLMLKSGNDRIATAFATLPAEKAEVLVRNWHNFIARGAGTSARRHSTAGFFHHLENLLKEAPERIEVLDGQGEQLGYFGRPDLIIKKLFGSVEKFVHKEFKNKAPGQLLSGKELAQLWEIIQAAKERAGFNRLPIEEVSQMLRDELGRTIYVFRGPPRQDLRDQMFKQAEKALGEGLKDLAGTLRDAAEFIGTLPF